MGMLSTEEVVDEDIRKEEKVRSIFTLFLTYIKTIPCSLLLTLA